MAKKSAVEKNSRRRGMVDRFAAKRAALKSIIMDRDRDPEERFEATLKLSELPRNGSKVSIIRRRRGDNIEIAVTDRGIGIARADQERVFERFFRVDKARSRATGGTGLGLAIVKHVLQRHGATLQIASVPGQGSVFSVDFPASRLRDAALPRPGAASA